MKKLLIILSICLIIVSGGILANHFLIQRFDQDSISKVYINLILDSDKRLAQLTEQEKIDLVKGLEGGTRLEDLSEIRTVTPYVIELVDEKGRSKAYKIWIMSDGEVIYKDPKGNHYISTNNSFFHSYKDFPGLYAFAYGPNLYVKIEEHYYAPSVMAGSWEYRLLDGRMVSTLRGIDHDEFPDINDTSQKMVIEVDIPFNKAYLRIIDEDSRETIFSAELTDLELPYPSYDGHFDYYLDVHWDSDEYGYRGSYMYTFCLEIDRPTEVSISKEVIEQGDVIIVQAKYVHDLDDFVVSTDIVERVNWVRAEGYYQAIIPTSYSTATGNYSVIVSDNDDVIASYDVIIVPRDFLIQYLVIDPNIEASTVNSATVAEYHKYFTPTRDYSAQEPYYTESFLLPAVGRLTTEYGETRYINGRPSSYRHTGLDIAAPIGTDILATNRGKVVLAMYLGWTGNSIVIDHGGGIFSVYYHMNELLVSEGDIVERGQLIAKMGTTGFSTGSHLHFQISYYHTNLEPGFFIYGEPILKTNFEELKLR